MKIRIKTLLQKITASKAILLIATFLAGLVIGYLISSFHVIGHVFSSIHSVHFNFNFDIAHLAERLVSRIDSNFLGDIIAIEAIIIALAIPMSLSLASSFKDYDRDISFFFIKEPKYQLQYWLLIPNIFFSLLLKSLDIHNKYLLFIILIWSLVNIGVFWSFIDLVHRYITNPDKLILKRLSSYVGNIFKEK